jgi:hypothetical protein
MGHEGKKPIRLPPPNTDPRYEKPEFYIEDMSDKWFDDCQSEWRISVEPKLRDQTRHVVFYYTAHARFLPTLSSKVRKRDLLRLAKHARELTQGFRQMYSSRTATGNEAIRMLTVGHDTWYALRHALDPDRDQYTFPKNLPQPPKGAVSQFLATLERFSNNLEKRAKAPPTFTRKYVQRGQPVAKPAEKSERWQYFRFLLEIFLQAGGKLRIGCGSQFSGFEDFVVSVTERIPRQAVQEYFGEGLDKALRDWIATEGVFYIMKGTRSIFRAHVALQLRTMMEIPC